MAPIFAYWDVRGIVGGIRFLLAHVNERYEFKGYTIESYQEWLDDKAALGETLDFPNLPYYIDGKVQITQSKVILAHIGRKYNLDGQTETEKIRMDLAIQEMEDARMTLVKIAYPQKTENVTELVDTLLTAYESGLPAKLARFSKFLGDNKWVAGDRLTYADFFVYDMLDWHRLLFNPKHVEEDKNISAYLKRFEGLSGVSEFMNSDSFSRLPVYAPFATIGNTKDWKPKV